MYAVHMLDYVISCIIHFLLCVYISVIIVLFSARSVCCVSVLEIVFSLTSKPMLVLLPVASVP